MKTMRQTSNRCVQSRAREQAGGIGRLDTPIPQFRTAGCRGHPLPNGRGSVGYRAASELRE